MIAKITNKKVLVWFSAVFFATCSLAAKADDHTDIRLRSLADESGVTQTKPIESKSAGSTVENVNPAATITTTEPETSSSPSANLSKTPDTHHQALEKAACFTAGVVVKTPSAVLRNSKTETISDTKELIGESKNPVLVGAAGALSLPFGVTSGLCEGICTGLVHSWKHCVFSEKSPSQPAP